MEVGFGTFNFIELETTAPKTCARLPMHGIEDARGNLPLS